MFLSSLVGYNNNAQAYIIIILTNKAYIFQLMHTLKFIILLILMHLTFPIAIHPTIVMESQNSLNPRN